MYSSKATSHPRTSSMDTHGYGQSLFSWPLIVYALLKSAIFFLFQWINSRTAVLLDSVEKLHVIDRQTQEELETIEISEVQLVYNSSHFKSLATGGNVSEALVGTNDLFVLANSISVMP